MTQRKTAINDDALLAFADDRLPAAERDAVAAYLADHPEQADRVAAWQRQNRDLRRAFDPVLREPVPTALVAAAMGMGQRPLRRTVLAAAASIVLFLGGGLAGWMVKDTFEGPEQSVAVQGFVQRAIVAHAVYEPEVRHPVEVGAAQLDHLVGWLSKRLGTKVKAPVLTKAGFTLVGGRLLPDASAPAAQFMYENKEGLRLTLYLRVAAKQNRETAFLWHQQGDLLTCYWLDGQVGYALSGRVPWKDMETLSKLVYDQIG